MKALSFKIGADTFALSFNHIQKVLEVPELFPVPLAPSFFQGALNFHNHIIPVLDLAAYLDVYTREQDARIIVLDLKYYHVALTVGPIKGKIDLEVIKALPTTSNSVMSSVSRLVALEDGSPIRILEPADLKQHLTSTILAKRGKGGFLSPSILAFAAQKKHEGFSGLTDGHDLLVDQAFSGNPTSNSR